MRYKTKEEIYLSKLQEVKNKYAYICKKCSHVIHIYPMENKTKKLCKFCGEYVFIDEKEKFKYNIEKRLNK